MHYVIQTETGLEITKTNPIDSLESIVFSGPVRECEMYIIIEQ